MHICIPDTREVRPQHGASYLLYNVHIDGLYHCSLRFKQLLHLHQALSKKFNSSSSSSSSSVGGHHHPLPSFPPKKLLPLSASRVEERRQQLEKYLQTISQDKTIANSTIFNVFLLEAQRESTRLVEPEKHVHLDIELVNGQKIRLPIVTHDSVDSVLTACCRAFGLDDRYHAYFCLCLCGYDVVRDKLIIKRKLSFFEAPFITLQVAIQQQEQLHNVLSPPGPSLHQSAPTTALVDGNNNNYNTRTTNLSPETIANSSNLRYNSNPCRCLSCSAQQQQQQQQQARHKQATTTTTGVPLDSSSDNNNSHHSHVDQQHSLSASNHYYHHECNGNNDQAWRSGRSQKGGSQFVTHRILLRKSYWDPIYDSYILNDQQALNLLFIQTVYDMKHSLMFVDRDTYHQLETYLANDSKLEYILLARTLKYYNYVHFEPCYSDYPRPRTKVMISIGSKELNIRVLKTPQPAVASSSSSSCIINATNSSQYQYQQQQQQQRQEPVLYCTSSLLPNGYRHLITKDDLIEEEYSFKVPLIRCWRLTSLETLNSSAGQQQPHRSTVTTTLAGGKRKSLSLFNSVIGNSISNTTSSPARAGTFNANGAHSNQLQGYGGQSLMSTMMASSDRQQQQRQQQRPEGLITNTSIGSNSFFNFRGNANQSSNSSNCNGNQYQSCQQEYQHSSCQQQTQANNVTSETAPDQTQLSQYELSFEYLIAKDTLKWITISSDQAIFISISLQGVVDELVSKRELGACLGDIPVGYSRDANTSSHDTIQPHVSRPISIKHRQADDDDDDQLSESFTYMCQDGGQKLIKSKSQQMLDRFCAGNSPPSLAASYSLVMARQHRLATSGAGGGRSGSFMGSSQSRSSSSILQATGLWGVGGGGGSQDPSNSSPGRHQFGQSSGSLGFSSNGSYNSAASSFEISQLNSGKKVPSPIINDAFVGVVTNDDDL